MSASHAIGLWSQGPRQPAFTQDDLLQVIQAIREPIHVIREPSGRIGAALAGRTIAAEQVNGAPVWPLMATLPAMYPEWLGDRSFCEVHGTRFPYVTGAMANGIATTKIVIAMAKHGMMGFFGSAGLTLDRVTAALDELERELGDRLPWGMNFIHSPNEPDLELGLADLYIRRGVKRVEAAAFMRLTPAIVRYAYTGLRADANGRIHRERHVFAKISRPETARHFLAPAPTEMLEKLVASGLLTAQEAELGKRLPVAEDVTVESDSGGHTDNMVLGALFPLILAVRDEAVAKYGFTRPIRIGAAGGLGNPTAVAAAFALGAAFVLTGSVNQACTESGLSADGKKLLATAGLGDVIMAPAADMFEMGVKVQVLKRGTMFGPRALRLYELYTTYDGVEAMPPAVKARLEKEILGTTCEEIWAGTKAFFEKRDPKEVARAEREPKHKMALIFRWYLGLSSKWAIAGDPARKLDFQIWCGPAIASFNDWTKGTFLEKPEDRTVVQVALNLLEGAAVVTRAHQLRTYGVPVPAAAFQWKPRPLTA